MHIKFAPIFLVTAFLALVKSEIGFYDCGSNFHIKQITISGCLGNPCHILRGSWKHVRVVFAKVPELDAMDTQAYVTMFGNKFALEVTVKPPCIEDCPLRHSIVGANYEMDVYFPSNLMNRPGELMINTTYVFNRRVDIASCIVLDVDILRA